MKTIYLLFTGLFVLMFLNTANCSVVGHWKKVLPAFDTLTVQVENGFICGKNKNERRLIVNEMYKLANAHKESPILYARAIYWDAQLKEDADSALFLLEKATSIVDAEQYEYDKFRIGHLQTKFHIDKGEWFPAYMEAKKQEKYFQEVKDTFMLAHVWVNLGIIMGSLENIEKSLDYLKKADLYFKRIGQSEFQVKNQLNMGNAFYCLGRKEEAIDLFKSLLDRQEARRDTSFYINLLLSLGCYDTDVKEVSKYTCKAYELAQAFGNRLLIVKASINKAMLLKNRLSVDSAHTLYRDVLDYSRETNNHETLLLALYGLTETFAASQRWDSAYHYSALYQSANDSMAWLNNLSEVNRIESRAVIEKYESDLVQMEVKSHLQRKVHIWILTATVSLSLLICLGFFYLHKKEKMKKQLKEAEVKELNVSLENEKLKNERYHLEIGSKNRELTSNIILLQEKNEVLRNILEQIDELSNESGETRAKAINLKKQIKKHLQTDDEWEYFKLHFESVYPEYFINLKKQYPLLTENDLRLCAYIRIGMSNKQIARMLSVQPDSIKISRYRIRKKFSLQQKDSLEDFLREF